MPQCPSCNKEIADDFGLANCSFCGVSVFVNMDGQVEIQSGAESNPEQVPYEEPANEMAFNNNENFQNNPPPVAENNSFLGTPNMAEEAYSEEPLVEDYEANNDGPVEKTEVMVEPNDEYFEMTEGSAEGNYSENIDENMDAADPNAINADNSIFNEDLRPKVNVDPSDISDIADFANSNSIEADDGDLRINVFISGIDTKAIREAIVEELTDKKLNIHVETLMNQVVNGTLKIQDLSPLKASIIVERLNNYSLSIRWEQYALSAI